MAKVDLEQVTKVYPGKEQVKAVDAIDLAIEDREFLVLVGPSGCGKTTTLRMVAGLEEISGGQIRIGDRVVNDIPAKDRDIAMVFQSYALYPHMTVYQNMAFALKLRKVPRDEIHQRVLAAAAMLGLDKPVNLLERKPKALSGGQKQRVAVGRAIVRNPKAFLFDEPLSNLDAKLRVETRAQIKQLHRRLQTTSIYVTHDQEEAMTLGDRIVVMFAGKIQQVAAPLTVYERPVNRFVASFVGTPPMNFMAGELTAQNGKVTFRESAENVLTLAPGHAKAVAGMVGQPVVLGVRPEVIVDHFDPNDPAFSPFAAKALVREPLGKDVDVFLATSANGQESSRLVCRLDARTSVREGEQAQLAIDMRRVHVFAPGELGANLTLSALD